MEISVIVPLYKSEKNIPHLINRLESINKKIEFNFFEVIFVIDGSPDNTFSELKRALNHINFSHKILILRRNYGSFSAIKAGFTESTYANILVMSADLQESENTQLQLIAEINKNQFDFIYGNRISRKDKGFEKFFSLIFWRFFSKFVLEGFPKKGIDIFACTTQLAREILEISEKRTSLVGQLFWQSGNIGKVDYVRQKPFTSQRSSWTLAKKVNYLLDSFFSFSALPIKIFSILSTVGLAMSAIVSLTILVNWSRGLITVPGYTALALLILLTFFFQLLSLSFLGSYLLRTYDNTKGRPDFAVIKIIKSNYKDD